LGQWSSEETSSSELPSSSAEDEAEEDDATDVNDEAVGWDEEEEEGSESWRKDSKHVTGDAQQSSAAGREDGDADEHKGGAMGQRETAEESASPALGARIAPAAARARAGEGGVHSKGKGKGEDTDKPVRKMARKDAASSSRAVASRGVSAASMDAVASQGGDSRKERAAEEDEEAARRRLLKLHRRAERDRRFCEREKERRRRRLARRALRCRVPPSLSPSVPPSRPPARPARARLHSLLPAFPPVCLAFHRGPLSLALYRRTEKSQEVTEVTMVFRTTP